MIDPAIDDLIHLAKKNLQAVELALKKMLLIGRDPFADEPLGRNLTGWRKLTVSNRDWRVIWRVISDDQGNVTVDVGEVWGVGARSDDEVYAEMDARLAQMKENPIAVDFADAIARIAKATKRTLSVPAPQPAPPELEPMLPGWLLHRLREQVGLRDEEIALLDHDGALEAWAAWRTGQP